MGISLPLIPQSLVFNRHFNRILLIDSDFLFKSPVFLVPGRQYISPRGDAGDFEPPIFAGHGKTWGRQNSNVSRHPRMNIAFETDGQFRVAESNRTLRAGLSLGEVESAVVFAGIVDVVHCW